MYDPRDRGLLDFLAAVVAMVAVYTGTPVGGLIDRGARKLLNLSPPTTPLIDYFETNASDASAVVKPGAEIAEQPITKPAEQDETLATVRPPALDPALARAFAVVASSGVVTFDSARRPWYDIRPLEHHAEDRQTLGLASRTAEVGGLTVGHDLARRLADASELVAALKKRLGGTDAALAAYALGLPLVERAVELATVSGHPDPSSLPGFGERLTRQDRERASGFVSAVQALRTAYGMAWPVPDTVPITSGFGMRAHPIYGAMRHHDGVDLGAKQGTPIRAAATGKVTYAGQDGTNGLYVKVDHGYGIRTAYCHASRLGVESGDRVEKGEIIAWVGSTGRSTGPHLHYGVFVAKKPVDPVIFRPPELVLRGDPEGGKGD